MEDAKLRAILAQADLYSKKEPLLNYDEYSEAFNDDVDNADNEQNEDSQSSEDDNFEDEKARLIIDSDNDDSLSINTKFSELEDADNGQNEELNKQRKSEKTRDMLDMIIHQVVNQNLDSINIRNSTVYRSERLHQMLGVLEPHIVTGLGDSQVVPFQTDTAIKYVYDNNEKTILLKDFMHYDENDKTFYYNKIPLMEFDAIMKAIKPLSDRRSKINSQYNTIAIVLGVVGTGMTVVGLIGKFADPITFGASSQLTIALTVSGIAIGLAGLAPRVATLIKNNVIRARKDYKAMSRSLELTRCRCEDLAKSGNEIMGKINASELTLLGLFPDFNSYKEFITTLLRHNTIDFKYMKEEYIETMFTLKSTTLDRLSNMLKFMYSGDVDAHLNQLELDYGVAYKIEADPDQAKENLTKTRVPASYTLGDEATPAKLASYDEAIDVDDKKNAQEILNATEHPFSKQIIIENSEKQNLPYTNMTKDIFRGQQNLERNNAEPQVVYGNVKPEVEQNNSVPIANSNRNINSPNMLGMRQNAMGKFTRKLIDKRTQALQPINHK